MPVVAVAMILNRGYQVAVPPQAATGAGDVLVHGAGGHGAVDATGGVGHLLSRQGFVGGDEGREHGELGGRELDLVATHKDFETVGIDDDEWFRHFGLLVPTNTTRRGAV